MKIPFFEPLLTNVDKKNVAKSLNQRWLTNGPVLKKFESKISDFIKTKYSLGVGSATHALHLSLRSIGISYGDEVIVPTFTFAATANSVIYCGAKPIFTDVDYETFNINPIEIQKKITKRTKAVIVVHYGGQACNMQEIISICKKKGLKLIEDCAHAFGSTYKNRKCGSFGATGCFSFYPTKIITTGEGGAISTNNSKLFKKILLLRSQGLSINSAEREKTGEWEYDIIDLGYNYRMDEIRASLGLSQMNRVNQINNQRINIAQKYNKRLRNIEGITIPKKAENRNHIFHLYTIKIDKNYPMTRNELNKKLFDAGIGTSVQYIPLHLMSYYKENFRLSERDYPKANRLYNEILCLPIYPKMRNKQTEFVISKIEK